MYDDENFRFRVPQTPSTGGIDKEVGVTKLPAPNDKSYIRYFESEAKLLWLNIAHADFEVYAFEEENQEDLTKNKAVATITSLGQDPSGNSAERNWQVNFNLNDLGLKPGIYYIRVRAVPHQMYEVDSTAAEPDEIWGAPSKLSGPIEHEVKVQYDITYTAIGNGTLTGPATASEGATVNVATAPDAGHRLVGISVSGGIGTLTDGTFTMPAQAVVVTAEFMPVTTDGGGGGFGGGPAVTPTPTPTPTPEGPDLVTELPKETITPTKPTAEEDAKADEAADKLAEDASDRWGAEITKPGGAIVIDLPEDRPIVVTIPEESFDYDTDDITVMAVLNPDGTLTPIPTRIAANGDVIVLLDHDAILVPLSVWATFTDIQHMLPHVREEIERAASLMVIEGYPDGTFKPGQQVTVQETVTMFLRAAGIPVEWATAMATGVANDFIPGGMTANAPMTRIQTAQLIVNALKHFGFGHELEADEIDELLEPFADMDAMSDADREAMAICVKLNIFRGMNETTMNPNGILNRSQMASLAVRMQDVLLGIVTW